MQLLWKTLMILGLAVAAQTARAEAGPAKTAECVPGKETAAVPVPVCGYFSAVEAIFRRGSTEQDVDRLFALVTPDVRYVHDSYEADFERAAWHEAFLRNVRNGAFGEPADFCMGVTDAIVGARYTAVEYVYGSRREGRCVPREEDRKLALFELEDGRISLIEEYW